MTAPLLDDPRLDDTAAPDDDDVTPEQLLDDLRYLEPEERMQLLADLDGHPVRQETFREYVSRVQPEFDWHPHNIIVASVLQDVADGLRLRVMIMEPPRHGKSSQVSRHFPAYYLYRHPRKWVGLATYGQDLSDGLSLAARTNFVEGGGELNPARAGVREWMTSEDGGMWAAGRGGPVTGKGGNLLIIDDLFKDHEEAKSKRVRDGAWEWYDSVFRTRQQPGEKAAIVIAGTRWHLDDHVGRLLAREGLEPERWHVVNLPALKEYGSDRRTPANGEPGKKSAYQWPATVTLEPDPRADGEALAPKLRSVEELLGLMRSYGGAQGYFWAALFQQRPTSRAGGKFKRDSFVVISLDEIPRTGMRWARAWDKAATEGDGDHTAGLLQGYHPETNRYMLVDLVHVQLGPGARDLLIRRTADADVARFKRVAEIGEQEPGAAGVSDKLAFFRLLNGHTVHVVPASTDKDTRSDPVAAAVENGLYSIVRAAWNEVLLNELANFGPGSDEDDIVDALSMGHNWLAANSDADPSEYKAVKR